MEIDLFILAAWGAAVLLSRKLFQDLFTPLCSYVSIWSFCLLLFRLRLVNYYELENRTVFLITGSILAFVFGCIVARPRMLAPASTRASDWYSVIQPSSLEPAIKLLFALNLVGTLIFTYQMNRTYGLATYIVDPAVIRQDFAEWTRVGPLGLLMMLDFPLLVCSWIHYLLTKKARWFTLLAVPLVSAQTFLKTDRGTLVIYAITCISLWVYWNGWRTLSNAMLRRLGAFALILLAYFLGIGLLYGKLVSMQTDVINLSDLSVTSEAGLVLITPYIYATSPIPGFQAAMEDVGRFSWGTHTFFPIARGLYSVGILDERPEAYDFDFYQVPIPVNTYTHLFAFYQDFGASGVIILPMVLGFIETRLYLQMKSNPNIFSLATTSAFTALNAFSVFVPLLTSIAFWYYFFVARLISNRCKRRAEVPGHPAQRSLLR
jgi:oligosaccharide repeat unit polymerase